MLWFDFWLLNSLCLEYPWCLWNCSFHFLWFCFWKTAIHIVFIFPMIDNFLFTFFSLNIDYIDYYRFQMLPSDKQINILLNHRTISGEICVLFQHKLLLILFFYRKLKNSLLLLHVKQFFMSKFSGSSHKEMFFLMD